MSAKCIVIDPTAAQQAHAAIGSHRLDSLQGKVVGFIDNAKPNFDHLACEIGTLLTERHGAARVVTHRKRSASLPAAAESLESLTAECDLVITGSGD
jgi:hypothetical protein